MSHMTLVKCLQITPLVNPSMVCPLSSSVLLLQWDSYNVHVPINSQLRVIAEMNKANKINFNI
jgi:hypothetical protein